MDFEKLAAVLAISNIAALKTGFNDGVEQGFELSSGMTYNDEESQWAYDVGTHIGACVAVR